MATTQNLRGFKSYARQTRTQYSEENFAKGMYYSNTPLAEGFVKLFINYDLKDDGALLVPRSGLRVNELALGEKASLPTGFSADMVISTGRDCVEDDANGYKQVIAGIPTDTKRTGTNLYTGESHVCTMDNSVGNNAIFEDITVRQFKTSPLAKTFEFKDNGGIPHMIPDLAYFKRPEQAEVHGMPIVDLNYMSRQVGTFAFNNAYYYFKQKRTINPVDGSGPDKNYLSRTRFNSTTGKYEVEAVSDKIANKALTPKEAVLYGYNMLQENPYTFSNVSSAGILQLLGILPYDKDGKIIVSPKINQTLYLECFYSGDAANKYKVVWDWREPGASSWTPFKIQEITLTDLPKMQAELSCPYKEVMIRLTAFKWVTDKYEDVAEKVMTVGLTLNADKSAGTTGKPVENDEEEAKVYDLSTCSGMTYWKNRLIVYGVTKDPTIVFFSAVNDPWYFPYPNNIDIFDEPVIHITPFLDNLLVFTSTKLHMLTLSLDGLTWNKKMIQGNLNIKDWDIHLIQTIKNMVFFKSGNYYYMVVPKVASLTGELTVAPISKPVEGLFDNFYEIIKESVDLLYNYQGTLELVHYYNFLDFEDIHNIYVFRTELGVYMNVDILYNTLLRMWRGHIYESQFVLQPYRQDATKKGALLSLAKLTYTEQPEPTTRVYTPGFGMQFYQFNPLNVKDLYIPIDYNVPWEWPISTAAEGLFGNLTTAFDAVHKIKNYQYLDAGYREHATDYNKRYREIQLKFNNISQRMLYFSTQFSLDGDARKSFYKYEAHQELDPADPNYGLIYLERVPNIQEILPGATMLAETENDNGSWALDQSLFPEIILWKVRIPISGRGYAPKIQLLSFNEERYELLNINWVFRMLSAR